MMNTCWTRLSADCRGSVAIIFGLCLMVMAGAAGVAIDFARMHSVQTALQQDIDRAALFVGTQLAEADENFDPKAAAQRFMDGLPREKQANGKIEIVDATSSNGRFVATAETSVRTTIMRLFGFKKSKVAATAEVEIGEQPLEIALVLDTTHSMSGSKMDALKTAAKKLVTTAYDVPRADENVKISIVPFAQYVNVGDKYRFTTWMDVPADSTRTENQCTTVYPDATSSNCRTETRTGYNDGVPYTYDASVCDWVYGDPVTECNDVVVSETWRGCAGSRTYPLNVRDDSYSTPIPGIMNAWCGEEMLELSNDPAAITAKIDVLSTSGDTYIPAGLVWGWRALSPEAPLDEAMAYGATKSGNKVRKILVLMTDGANTRSKNPSDGAHWGMDAVEANRLTQELCTNIKAKGITVFTVAYDINDVTTETMLQNCASSTQNYFDASGAEELGDAFAEIAQSFAPLRLTR